MASPIVLSSDDSDDDDVVVVCETKAPPKDLDEDGDIVFLAFEKRCDKVQIQEKDGLVTSSTTDSSSEPADLTASVAHKSGEPVDVTSTNTDSSEEPVAVTPSNTDSSVEPVDLTSTAKTSSGGHVNLVSDNTDTCGSGRLDKSAQPSGDQGVMVLGIPNVLPASHVSSASVKQSTDNADDQSVQNSGGYGNNLSNPRYSGTCSLTSQILLGLSPTDSSQSSILPVPASTASASYTATSSTHSIYSFGNGNSVTSNLSPNISNSFASHSSSTYKNWLLPPSIIPGQQTVDDLGMTPQPSTASGPSLTRSLSCTSNSTITGNSYYPSCPPRKRLKSDSQAVQPACGLLVPATWSTCCTVCGEQGRKVSHCMQRHQTCCICLEDRAKCILSDKKGVTLRCLYSGCDSFYPMSELKHTLPGMVVDVLEIQLEKHYVDYLADMVMKEATGEEDHLPHETETQNPATETLQIKSRDVSMDVPSSWVEMDHSTPFTLVQLEPETEDYVSVSLKFHETMQFGSVDIDKIYRVQNPILWKFYSVKKQQMNLDHGGEQVDEKLLFHGTNDDAVDAICKSGFDWRLCGKHGTMYGQGSYFAKTASYSHQYSAAAVKVNRARKHSTLSNLVYKQRLHSMTQQYCTLAKKTKFLNTLNATAAASSAGLPTFGRNLLYQYSPGSSSSITPTSASYNSSANNSALGSLTMSHAVAGPFPAVSNMVSASNTVNHNNTTNTGTSSTGTNFPPPPLQVHTSTWQSTQPNSNPLNLSVSNYSSTNAAPNTSAPPNVSVSTPGIVVSSNGSSGINTWAFHAFTPPVNQIGNILRGLGPPPNTQPPSSLPQTDSDTPLFKMFLARVLVGQYTVGNNGLRKPPPLHPDSDPYGMCFDTCVDNVHSPKIYVVFDSAQAYPEYIVHYKQNIT